MQLTQLFLNIGVLAAATTGTKGGTYNYDLVTVPLLEDDLDPLFLEDDSEDFVEPVTSFPPDDHSVLAPTSHKTHPALNSHNRSHLPEYFATNRLPQEELTTENTPPEQEAFLDIREQPHISVYEYRYFLRPVHQYESSFENSILKELSYPPGFFGPEPSTVLDQNFLQEQVNADGQNSAKIPLKEHESSAVLHQIPHQHDTHQLINASADSPAHTVQKTEPLLAGRPVVPSSQDLIYNIDLLQPVRVYAEITGGTGEPIPPQLPVPQVFPSSQDSNDTHFTIRQTIIFPKLLLAELHVKENVSDATGSPARKPVYQEFLQYIRFSLNHPETTSQESDQQAGGRLSTVIADPIVFSAIGLVPVLGINPSTVHDPQSHLAIDLPSQPIFSGKVESTTRTVIKPIVPQVSVAPSGT